jgi:segregation and condensation protein B
MTLRRAGEGWRFYTREEFAPGRRAAPDRRRAQPAHPGGPGDARRHRLPAAGDPGAGVGDPGRRRRRRHAHAADPRLVAEVGTDPDSGGGLYGTTPLFLERLGLAGLHELPPLAPLLPDAAAVAREHPERR